MIKDLLNARPVVLGRVKIGEKGDRHPEKFDHFRLYQPGKDDKGQPVLDVGLQTLLESKYGKPLRKLPIFFLCNTTAANFDCNYSYYKKFGGETVLVCQGDGERATQCIPVKTPEGLVLKRDDRGKLVKQGVPCPCDRFNPDPDADAKQHPCKWAAKLAFMLQDVPKGGGYYLFRTHSLNSIKNLWFALQQMESFTFGNMAGIPVNLILESQRNKRNMEIFVVRVEWDFDPKAMRLKAIEEVRSVAHLKGEIAAAEASARKLLTTDDPDEDIVEEFYPETQDATPVAPKVKANPQATPAETKLDEMLHPETTADRLNRELAEERAKKSAPDSAAPAPSQTAQDAPQAPKKRGRKPKAQQPAPAVQPPAQPATAPPAPAPTPASPTPPAEQPDLLDQEQESEPVPDVTSKPEAGEDVNARFF